MMHDLIGCVALLALATPLAAQVLPDSIDQAIAEGVKTRDCRSVSLVPGSGAQYGKSNYSILVEGPMLRVACRAAGVARQHKTFERSMLSAKDTSAFLTVTAYPNGEIRPHLIARPSNVVLKTRGDQTDSIIQPDSLAFDVVSLRDGLGAVLEVPRIVAYFAPARWPLVDFQIAVVTSGPEYRAKVGKSERARIH